MKPYEVRVVDLSSRPQPILMKIRAADVWEASREEQSFEKRLGAKDAFQLGLELIQAAARVGVTVRD